MLYKRIYLRERNSRHSAAIITDVRFCGILIYRYIQEVNR